MSDGLFDVPADAYLIPPEPEQLSRSEKRHRLIAKRIAQGMHPLGYVRLHPDAPRGRDDAGPRCGDCRWRVMVDGHYPKRYPKCHFPTQQGDKMIHPRDTGCESSDIRAWWPACRDFEVATDA